MTRGQAIGLGAAETLLGGASLVLILVAEVRPFFPDGRPNVAALVLALICLLLLLSGVGTLTALVLHSRWPALAGVRGRRAQTDPAVAARQGTLFALSVGVLVLLAYFQFADVAFVIVTFLVAGLFEAYLQSRD